MATHPFLKVRGLHLKRPASLRLLGATASAAAGGHLPNEVVEVGVDFASDRLPFLAQGVDHLAASEHHVVAAHGPAFEACDDLRCRRHFQERVCVIATAHLAQKLNPEI